MKLKVKRDPTVWNAHVHSHFSAKDALPSIDSLVQRAAELGQPALALTDHGNMAGSVQLYKSCSKHSLRAFPGTELYVVANRADKKAKRHHLVVEAFTTEGYKNLVNLSTLSHRNFHNKPLLDHEDLAQLADDGRLKGIACLTGCVSGFVNESILMGEESQAKAFIGAYASWFDRCYVELQNHGTLWTPSNMPGMTQEMSDADLADRALVLAQEVGVPCILTNDVHYSRLADKRDHESLKRLVSFGPDRDDGVFLGDGFHLADYEWFANHHTPERLAAGIEGLEDLLAAHTLAISQLDNYAYNIPFTVEEPDRELRRQTLEELKQRGLSAKHRTVLEEELSTFEATRMSGYILLVAEVTEWCRENKVFFQARGSAAGSVACWLMGITPVDPLKWGLSHERFVSRDRTKPPDIDLDVEHTRRADLLEYLRGRFAVSQIGTWGLNKLSGDVDPDSGEETGKGTLRVQYFARKKQLGEDVPKDWMEVPEEDREMLHQLNDLKTYSHYGKHAAGVIITTTQTEIDEMVPLMWVASSKTFVSQFAMDDVEALGLVKLDVLGLKTLSTLHICMDNLGREVELDWIPLRDARTYRAIARGDTDGVFQLEGWSARRGCRDLAPTRVQDVIAAMALFRPATMDSGATADYIAHKHGDRKAPERHELLMKVTKDTYGILLFQEQVIAVLRALGMDPDNLTKFLKAVKASNQNIGDAGKVIGGYEEQIKAMAERAGIGPDDLQWFWAAITGFAAYGFNQAHSTVYGLTAYRCAYLSVNEPVAFHAALLAVAAGTDKEPKYISATRAKKISILSADIEDSGVTYSVASRGTAVRKGLMAIKGVGEKVARAVVDVRPPNGFADIETFAQLVDHRKVTGTKDLRLSGSTGVGMVNRLYEAGALRKLLTK